MLLYSISVRKHSILKWLHRVFSSYLNYHLNRNKWLTCDLFKHRCCFPLSSSPSSFSPLILFPSSFIALSLSVSKQFHPETIRWGTTSVQLGLRAGCWPKFVLQSPSRVKRVLRGVTQHEVSESNQGKLGRQAGWLFSMGYQIASGLGRASAQGWEQRWEIGYLRVD